MNFDGTTFVLEVLNFLVLVWLLRRFLYRPVLDVIERRRAREEKTVADASALREEALALKSQVEGSLARAAEERERARARLDDEVATQRAQRLAELDGELAAERQRRHDLDEREERRRDAERDREAAALALRLAARLLARLADPALEDRLVALALADLASLPDAQREPLRAALGDPGVAVEVTTAYPLPPARQAQVTAALGALAGRELAPRFAEDASVEAGVRVRAGAWELTANLRDELAFFATALDHDEA